VSREEDWKEDIGEKEWRERDFLMRAKIIPVRSFGGVRKTEQGNE
jgi:hypothetical protein